MRSSKDAAVRIGGIVDISTVDWPSKISSVVFFSGCNFRCPTCQNGKLVDVNYGKSIDISDLVKIIMRSRPLIEGVVVSGGECTLQVEGLLQLCRKLKEEGLGVGIDTNGSRPQVIESLLKEGFVDRVAFDLKAPLKPEIYERVIGLPNQGKRIVNEITKTLDLLLNSKVEVEVRFLAVPNLTNNVEYVKEVAKVARGATRFVIQQFRPEADLLDPSYKVLKPPTKQELIKLARAAREEGITDVYIRTKEGGLERIVG